MTIETPTNKIAAIQMLRGIAALMVVVHHLQNQLEKLGLATINSGVLASGVDIFFVISGFIMWITTTTDRPHTATSFYKNRVARVVPLYWALTTLVVLIALAYPQALSTTQFDMPHVIFSYLFVASEHPATGFLEPILIPGWTLNLEMFFYLIFGAIISISGNRPGQKALLSIGVLGILSLAGYWLAPQGVASFYTTGLLLEFSAGIGLGILYTRGIIKPSNGWLVVAAGGVFFLAAQLYLAVDVARELKWGIPAVMIVSGAALSHDIRAIALEWLGDISYSLYLSHPIALAVSYKVWVLGAAMPPQTFPIFAIAVCLISAAGTFYLLEIPSTKIAKRMLNSRQRRQGRSLPARPLLAEPIER